MKKLLILLLTLVLIISIWGCDQEQTRRSIPKENVAKADSFVIKQMEAIKITNRYENEDYDDFLAQAKWNALEIYGRDTLGIWNHSVGFIPYDLCTPDQKESLRKRMVK